MTRRPKVFGIDFGTSNSVVACGFDDGTVELLRFEHRGLLEVADSANSPSVLFYPSYDRATFVGYAAIQQYLDRGLEGRFIQSIKAFLPVASFSGTTIRGRFLSIEALVSEILGWLVGAAEQRFGGRPDRIVLGRPACYSRQAAGDTLAEARFLACAKAVGLEGVELLIEPIAAAYAYESALETDETVLVADLGGGTSDFTLMRVGPSQRGLSARTQSVLASGGVPVAGDRFDGEIVRHCLLDQLGYGSRYRAFTDLVEVPHSLFRQLLRWNHVSFLKSREMLSFLHTVHSASERPEAIEKLLGIVENDMGYLLFRAVERAKRTVSVADVAWIEDAENDLPVRARLSREDFEIHTAPLVREILSSAESVVATAGIDRDAIDAVFMTGGTSLLPNVRAAFAGAFGEARIRTKETFTSVADGLARSAM